MRKKLRHVMVFTLSLLLLILCDPEKLFNEEFLQMFIECFAYMSKLETKMLKKRITVFFPSQEIQVWQDCMFEKMTRFRRTDYCRILDSMSVRGLMLSCGPGEGARNFPMELCFAIVCRRLSFGCRFVDLVNVFGLSSTKICEIFHATIDFLWARYAYKLNQLQIWTYQFKAFSEVMMNFGAPYNNLVGLLDGHFYMVSRPGGLGNVNFRLDQSELYSGEKALHGIKYLVAQFPNGMTTLSRAFKGRTHDARMLQECGWTETLRSIKHHTGKHYLLFGDAGFAVSDHIQAMIKFPRSGQGYQYTDARRFNNLMARIRIHIENAFAASANTFSYLTHKNHLKLGGRNIDRIFEVANFLMNVHTTFYGNQFTAALRDIVDEDFGGFAYEEAMEDISVERFLSMAETGSE